MPPKLPPHVWAAKNRTGRTYYYLTLNRGTGKQAKSVRLPDDPRSAEFWTEYARHRDLPSVRQPTNTVSLMIEAWHKSPEWIALSPGTQREWTRHCNRIKLAWGDYDARGIGPKQVLDLRDAFAATPASANNMLRCLSSMMTWAAPREWVTANPCRDVKPLKGGDGYAPWTWDVIEAARGELREDLWWAVALALYTGQRQGDCLAMRWNAIDAAGRISVRQEKTKAELVIPIHRDLRAVLDTIPRRAVTILTSSEGTPWRGGFQMSWNKHKPALVLERGLVFHGLRKSAVVMLLEAGCSVAQVASITGQSIRMVEHYAAKLNQEKLAAEAILKWEQSR